jgi:DNA-binding NtrC family response regulator
MQYINNIHYTHHLPEDKSKSKLIYIVEDDLLQANILTDFLVRQGYEVAHLKSIRELKYQMKQLTPDAMLLDVCLPEGYTAGLNFLEGLQQAIPTFVITNHDTQETCTRAALCKAKYIFGKPVDFNNLKRNLERVL